MKIKKSVGSWIFDTGNYTFMVLLMIVTVYPFWNVFVVSISGNEYVSRGLVNMIPRGINFDMYELLLRTKEVQRAYLNTLIYAVGGTLLTLALNSIYAYTLSKPNLPGKGFLTLFIAITMFFSGGLIPTFLVIKALRGLNTWWVMMLPGCVSAWNIIIMRTFFQGIPYSLTESALIDGAGEVRTLTSIILPLSKPLYATMTLFSVVGIWNSWFSALIYLTKIERYPIQMMLREITVVGRVMSTAAASDMMRKGQQAAMIIPQSYKYAMMMIVIIPIVCMYPFFQKYFIKGVMVGAIKG